MSMCVSHLQTVDKLREHLNKHLPRLGKKKIDSLVVNYVAKLVGVVCLSQLINFFLHSFFIGGLSGTAGVPLWEKKPSASL